MVVLQGFLLLICQGLHVPSPQCVAIRWHPFVLLLLEDLPHLCYKVRCYQICGVSGDNPQNKHTVLTEVIVGKPVAKFTVKPALKLVGYLQVFLYEGYTVLLNGDSVAPGQKIVYGKGSDKEKPKPQENENFLVEQVDWKHALDCEALNVFKLANFEITEGDSWETWALSPRGVRSQAIQDFEAVDIIIGGHESVEQEELANDVSHIQSFDGKVQAREECAASFAANEATDSGDLLPCGGVSVPGIVALGV